MNKFILLGLVALCFVTVAKANEDFHNGWKRYMNEKFCSSEASEEDKKKFMECSALIPEKVQELMEKETGTETLEEAMGKMCDDEALGEKICQTVQKDKDEMGVTDELVKELMECKNK